MSDDVMQDVLIMTGNLSLDAALALVMSQQNEIESLKEKYARLKSTHIETAKESSLREADNQDLRAEVEKLKIQCDEEYLSGMKHGWNCCVSNNEARYQQSVNIAREQIVSARAAAAALKETGDE